MCSQETSGVAASNSFMATTSCSRARRRSMVRTVWAAIFCAVRCNQPESTGRSASWLALFARATNTPWVTSSARCESRTMRNAAEYTKSTCRRTNSANAASVRCPHSPATIVSPMVGSLIQVSRRWKNRTEIVTPLRPTFRESLKPTKKPAEAGFVGTEVSICLVGAVPPVAE